MTWIVAVKWENDAQGTPRCVKHEEFDTEALALEHVSTIRGRYPDAFAHRRPASLSGGWEVDERAKSLLTTPPSTPDDTRMSLEDFCALFTDAEVRDSLQGVVPSPALGGVREQAVFASMVSGAAGGGRVIDLTSTGLIALLDDLVTRNALTASRRATILGGGA